MSCKELTVIPVQKSLRRKSWEELLQVTATPKVNMGTCLLSEVGEGDSERKQRFLSQTRKLFFSSGKPAPVAAPQQLQLQLLKICLACREEGRTLWS